MSSRINFRRTRHVMARFGAGSFVIAHFDVTVAIERGPIKQCGWRAIWLERVATVIEYAINLPFAHCAAAGLSIPRLTFRKPNAEFSVFTVSAASHGHRSQHPRWCSQLGWQ